MFVLASMSRKNSDPVKKGIELSSFRWGMCVNMKESDPVKKGLRLHQILHLPLDGSLEEFEPVKKGIETER